MKLNKRSPKWYGWLPDPPDHRDFMYSAIAPRIARLPKKVDLRQKCSPVENQGQLGSCTANALVGALEFLELKDGVPFVDLRFVQKKNGLIGLLHLGKNPL